MDGPREAERALRAGAEAWNRWREADPKSVPDLRRVHLVEFAIAHAHMAGALFSMARLDRVKFEDLDLRGADFTRARVRGWFGRCDLSGARFDGACCDVAHFNCSDMSGASFQGSELSGSGFYDSTLRGCSFADTDLTGVAFFGSDVSGAVFSQAKGAQPTILKQAMWRPGEPPLLPARMASWLDANGHRFQVVDRDGEEFVFDAVESDWPSRKNN